MHPFFVFVLFFQKQTRYELKNKNKTKQKRIPLVDHLIPGIAPKLTMPIIQRCCQPLSRSELRSRVEVEVDVLDSPSLIVPTVSVDVKQK